MGTLFKRILITILIILLLSFLIYNTNQKTNPNEKMKENGYVGNRIKKVEINNEYVCFILDEFRAISCFKK